MNHVFPQTWQFHTVIYHTSQASHSCGLLGLCLCSHTAILAGGKTESQVQGREFPPKSWSLTVVITHRPSDGIPTTVFREHKWREKRIFKSPPRKIFQVPGKMPGESQGRGSLVGCPLWGHTESDTTEAPLPATASQGKSPVPP